MREGSGREDYAQQSNSESCGAHCVDAFATEERERDGERRVARGDWANDAQRAVLEGMVERERRQHVQQTRGDGHGPGLPARRDAMRKTAGGFQVDAEREETEKLHEEKSAIRADAARRETRGEIRGSPGKGARQSQDDGERNIHGAENLAFSGLQAQDGHHFLQVFPDFALRWRIAQQVGGMIRGD